MKSHLNVTMKIVSLLGMEALGIRWCSYGGVLEGGVGLLLPEPLITGLDGVRKSRGRLYGVRERGFFCVGGVARAGPHPSPRPALTSLLGVWPTGGGGGVFTGRTRTV